MHFSLSMFRCTFSLRLKLLSIQYNVAPTDASDGKIEITIQLALFGIITMVGKCHRIVLHKLVSEREGSNPYNKLWENLDVEWHVSQVRWDNKNMFSHYIIDGPGLIWRSQQNIEVLRFLYFSKSLIKINFLLLKYQLNKRRWNPDDFEGISSTRLPYDKVNTVKRIFNVLKIWV